MASASGSQEVAAKLQDVCAEIKDVENEVQGVKAKPATTDEASRLLQQSGGAGPSVEPSLAEIEAAVAAALQPVREQLTAVVSQLTAFCEQLTNRASRRRQVIRETKSETRHASEIGSDDLETFRLAAKVEISDVPGNLTFTELSTKDPEADGFAWDSSLSEPKQVLLYWTERVQQAADTLKLPLHARILARSTRGWNRVDLADSMSPARFRHWECPFTLSGNNDVACCLGSLNESAILGVKLKKDLDEQALREAEVAFYTWDFFMTYPYLQMVTDLRRGGAAIWCEAQPGHNPGCLQNAIVRRQIFGSMREVYEFVAKAIHHLPDHIVKGTADANGIRMPPQLQEPTRVKFITRSMVLAPYKQLAEEECETRSVRTRQRQARSGCMSQTQLLYYLATLRANADDVANIRDLDDFE